MAASSAVMGTGERRTFVQKMLDGIERLGNRVPHPVLMFLYLIGSVIALSAILGLAHVSVTETITETVPYAADKNYYADTTEVQNQVPREGNEYSDVQFVTRHETIAVQSLLTIDGIRYIFTSFVSNFQNFGVVAVTFIAMLGAGVAEAGGLMGALIRKLVAAAPRVLITFLIVLVGGLSSVASDAGYLILIPLAAAAFLSLRRHPLAGLAAGFAGVAATFAVNIIPQPIDAMITEIANETITTIGARPITILNNYYFGVVSLLLMCVVATVITERLIEPRLGAYAGGTPAAEGGDEPGNGSAAAEARGLRFALFGFLGVLAVVVIATAPPGAPLRDPETGQILGSTPFMDSLLFIIALFFLVCGICYGYGSGTFKSSGDVIASVTKTFNTLGGLVFMLLMISQFIAYFNYSRLPTVAAVGLADLLERASIPALLLLVAFIVVILLLDVIIPGVIPKWAIFAPVFVPIFLRLGVEPQTLLAAYRIGDSPVNTLTPLMVYLPFIVTVAQRYRSDAGIGTVVSLMLPYALIMAVVWVLLFVVWFALSIPLGPGYPVRV